LVRRSPFRRHIKVGAVVAVAASSVIAVTLVISAPLSSTGSDELYSWAFPGAYAEYLGSGTIQGVPISLNHTLGILRVNSTKAEFLIVTLETMDSGPPHVDRSIAWLPATVSDNPPFLVNDGGVKVVRYVTNITLEGKVLPVIANSILGPSGGNLNITSYVSRDLHFPIEYVLSFGNGPPVTLRVVRTNIPGLLP
jgi:hypothetical protein